MRPRLTLILAIALLGAGVYGASGALAKPEPNVTGTAAAAGSGGKVPQAPKPHENQILEWNQIFVDTLIATNTANSSSVASEPASSVPRRSCSPTGSSSSSGSRCSRSSTRRWVPS